MPKPVPSGPDSGASRRGETEAQSSVLSVCWFGSPRRPSILAKVPGRCPARRCGRSVHSAAAGLAALRRRPTGNTSYSKRVNASAGRPFRASEPGGHTATHRRLAFSAAPVGPMVEPLAGTSPVGQSSSGAPMGIHEVTGSLTVGPKVPMSRVLGNLTRSVWRRSRSRGSRRRAGHRPRVDVGQRSTHHARRERWPRSARPFRHCPGPEGGVRNW